MDELDWYKISFTFYTSMQRKPGHHFLCMQKVEHSSYLRKFTLRRIVHARNEKTMVSGCYKTTTIIENRLTE